MKNMGDIRNVRIVNFDDAIKKAESHLSHLSMVTVVVMSQKRMYILKQNGPEFSKDSPALKDLTESAKLYHPVNRGTRWL